MHSPQADAASTLPEGPFSGRTEFAARIRQALAGAARQGWREIIWCDPDFADWPLGERAVVQSLQDWSRGGRKLTLIATHYDAVLRRHARFVTWRRTWSHLVECRKCGAASAGSLPSAFWSPEWIFERLDMRLCTGSSSTDAVRRQALKECIQAHVSGSSAGFPATVLGL
ncbi:MAG: hypothetical protein JWR74_1111 [Polaromonas sp.]|nr:hypothetical protein [Polaromonas sp.]